MTNRQDDNHEYRGAHRRDEDLYDDRVYDAEAYEDYEGDYADGYEDQYADDAESPSSEGNYIDDEGVGEAGERREAKAPGGSTAVVAGGVPKRGLAMILIAVGALLLLWGIYALTQRDGQDAAQAGGAETQTETVATSAATSTATSAAPGAATETVVNTATETVPAGQPGAPAPAPAPVPSGPELTAGDAQVFVFNNSSIPNAASDMARSLDQQYTIANNSPDAAAMNMPEQNYGVFPETYVFYNPQVAGAEQIAADVARRVGGTPRATNDLPQGAAGLPSEANGRNAITVVLAG